MNKYDKQLEEIQSWCNDNDARLEILFSAFAGASINNVLHPWQVTIGRGQRKWYHAYGTSMPDAISICHQRWQNRISGWVWAAKSPLFPTEPVEDETTGNMENMVEYTVYFSSGEIEYEFTENERQAIISAQASQIRKSNGYNVSQVIVTETDEIVYQG